MLKSNGIDNFVTVRESPNLDSCSRVRAKAKASVEVGHVHLLVPAALGAVATYSSHNFVGMLPLSDDTFLKLAELQILSLDIVTTVFD